MIIEAADLATHEGLTRFQTVCLEHRACQPALDWIAHSISQGWTLQQFIDNTIGDDRSSWAEWVRTTMAASLDEQVRFAFGVVAAEGNPRVAAQLCYDRDDMGLDEAITLLAEWHSALREDDQPLFPTIEAELIGKAS